LLSIDKTKLKKREKEKVGSDTPLARYQAITVFRIPQLPRLLRQGFSANLPPFGKPAAKT
jgi:hypothetical protein